MSDKKISKVDLPKVKNGMPSMTFKTKITPQPKPEIIKEGEGIRSQPSPTTTTTKPK